MRLFKGLVICCLLVMVVTGCTTKTALWNGKDYSGWKLHLDDKSVDVNSVWSVKNGVVHCKGAPRGYMRTEVEYSNYILEMEWRWVEKGSNSGVLLHSQKPDKVWPICIECQLKSGNAGDFVLLGKGSITVAGKKHENDGVYHIISKMKESSEKPIGEWNRYKIICKDDSITCYVNGVLQNTGTRASQTKGTIALQSEGAPIEFRKITIQELDDE